MENLLFLNLGTAEIFMILMLVGVLPIILIIFLSLRHHSFNVQGPP